MTQQPVFRATADSVRRDARAKLLKLRQVRMMRKQRLMPSAQILAADFVDEPSMEEISAYMPKISLDMLPETRVAFGSSFLDPISHPADSDALTEEHRIPDSENRESPAVWPEATKGNDAFKSESASRNGAGTAESIALAEIDHLEGHISLALPLYQPFEDADYGVEESNVNKEAADAPMPDDQQGQSPIGNDAPGAFRTKRNLVTDDLNVSRTTENSHFGRDDAPQSEPLFKDLHLAMLPGIGPGLIWMLNGCGIRDLRDLAQADHAKLRADLGLVAQILDVGFWIEFARSKILQETAGR